MSVLATHRVRTALAALTMASLAPEQVLAAGDLLVAPTRVVLNGSQGTEIILSNIGAQPATYRISLELRRMNEKGELEDVDPAAASALETATMEMIRYAPKRITLPPNQPQAVRISARPGADLPDGEYRVHMSFRGVPPQTPAASEPAGDGKSLSIQLVAVYGVTIPIIVRKGTLEATAAISNPKVVRDRNGAHLTLDVARSGNRSIYGEIAVFAKGAKDPIYRANGVALYPEITRRSVSLPLAPEESAKLKGPVRIEYRESPEYGGKMLAAVDANLG